MLVIDASVAVKWLVPEVGHEEAGRVLEGRDELIAPSIILMEVHSAILTRERLESLPPLAAKRPANSGQNWLPTARSGLFPSRNCCRSESSAR